jgi:hypothetical protein
MTELIEDAEELPNRLRVNDTELLKLIDASLFWWSDRTGSKAKAVVFEDTDELRKRLRITDTELLKLIDTSVCLLQAQPGNKANVAVTTLKNLRNGRRVTDTELLKLIDTSLLFWSGCSGPKALAEVINLKNLREHIVHWQSLAKRVRSAREVKIDAYNILHAKPLELPHAANEISRIDFERRLRDRINAALILYDLPPTSEGWTKLTAILLTETFPGLRLTNSPINNLPVEISKKDKAFRDRAVKIAHSNIKSGRFSSKLKAFQDAANSMNCRNETPIPDPDPVKNYARIDERDVKNWYDYHAKMGILPDCEPEYSDKDDDTFIQAAQSHLNAVDSLFKVARQLGAGIYKTVELRDKEPFIYIDIPASPAIAAWLKEQQPIER